MLGMAHNTDTTPNALFHLSRSHIMRPPNFFSLYSRLVNDTGACSVFTFDHFFGHRSAGAGC